MTNFFTLFIFFVCIAVGLNLVVGVLIGEFSPTDPNFANFDIDFPAKIAANDQTLNSTAGNVDCDSQGGLLGDLCTPSGQVIETEVTGNTTTSEIQGGASTEVTFGQDEENPDIIAQVFDFGRLALVAGNIFINAITGTFIIDVISAIVIDDDTKLPQEFINGIKIIVILMWAGFILGLIFQRNALASG